MTDIFLMESYVSEKMISVHPDSITTVKLSFYKKILADHKVDSLSYYTTFNYLQAHPKELLIVLNLVDSALGKIKPGDTSTVVQKMPVYPADEGSPDFKIQERKMREDYLKSSKAKRDSLINKKKKTI